MLLEAIAQTRAAVAASPGRKKKVEQLAAVLLQAAPGERAIAARYLAGEVGHKTGLGHATVHGVRPRSTRSPLRTGCRGSSRATLPRRSRSTTGRSPRATKG